jgi:tetratricopeptide (TPR) repeat protein
MDTQPFRSLQRNQDHGSDTSSGEREARRARPYAWYLVVFAVAFVIRAIYLLELRDSPLLSVLMVDARAYDEWAQRIAAGNWFGDEVFYQAPFYPYFLACIYKLFDHNVSAVRTVQILIGSASCLLVMAAGLRFFSLRVGVVAGLLLAVYPPVIFFDALIQKAVLGVFFMALLLFTLARTLNELQWQWLLASGVVLGCFVLTRENALILVPVIVVWILVRSRPKSWILKAASVAAFGVGIACVLVPVGLRNRVIGGEFILTTSQLGPNFYIGNNSNADGRTAPVRPRRDDPAFERDDSVAIAEASLGRELTPGEVSRYWLERSLTYIRSQPGHWMRLLLKKCYLVWHRTEIMDAEAIEAYQRSSGLLHALGWGLHLGTICPLAVIGVWATRSKFRRIWLLHALVLAVAVSITLFFVNARYRVVMIPGLVMLAAAGLIELSARLRRPRLKALLPISVLLAASALVTNGPAVPQADPVGITFGNLGTALARQGRFEEALYFYRKAIGIIPGLDDAHYAAGKIAREMGRVDEAVEHLRRALELRPDHVVGYNEFGLALRAQKKLSAAVRQYEKAIELHPQYYDARNNLGNALARLGKRGEAIESYRRAIEIDPDLVEAHFNLAVTLARMRRFDEAGVEIEIVISIDPENAEAHCQLGRVLAESGDTHGAAEHLEIATRIRPDFATAHSDLGRVFAAQRRFDEARRSFERAIELDPGHEEARANLARLLAAPHNAEETPSP